MPAMLAVRSHLKQALFLILIGSFSQAFAGTSKIIEARVPGSKVPVKFSYKQTEHSILIYPENTMCTKPVANQSGETVVNLPANDPVVHLKKKYIEGKGNCITTIRVSINDGLENAVAYYLNLDATTADDNAILGMLHACIQDLKLGDI